GARPRAASRSPGGRRHSRRHHPAAPVTSRDSRRACPTPRTAPGRSPTRPPYRSHPGCRTPGARRAPCGGRDAKWTRRGRWRRAEAEPLRASERHGETRARDEAHGDPLWRVVDEDLIRVGRAVDAHELDRAVIERDEPDTAAQVWAELPARRPAHEGARRERDRPCGMRRPLHVGAQLAAWLAGGEVEHRAGAAQQKHWAWLGAGHFTPRAVAGGRP